MVRKPLINTASFSNKLYFNLFIYLHVSLLLFDRSGIPGVSQVFQRPLSMILGTPDPWFTIGHTMGMMFTGRSSDAGDIWPTLMVIDWKSPRLETIHFGNLLMLRSKWDQLPEKA